MARRRDDDYEDDDYDDRPRGRARDDDDDDYDDRPSRRRGSPPPNYLVPSIIVTLCCCLIGGIVAIVNASQVNSKWEAGDYAGAKKASEQAKLWCIISVVGGLITNAILVAVQVAAIQQQQGR